MEKFDIVKVNTSSSKILNDSMKDWLLSHKDISFKVERVVDHSIKLFKVDFWISEDLLIKQ